MEQQNGITEQVEITFFATNTFPLGFTVTQDIDSLNIPSNITHSALGVNGDLVTWIKPAPCSMTLNVVSGSENDKNLSILANSNRIALGKSSAQDKISATVAYPDGKVMTLDQGAITHAPFGNGQYSFMFSSCK